MRAYSRFEGTTWHLRIALDQEDDIHGLGQWDIPIELTVTDCRVQLPGPSEPHPDLVGLSVLSIVRPWAKKRILLDTPVSEHFAHVVRTQFDLEIGPTDPAIEPRAAGDGAIFAMSLGPDCLAADVLLGVPMKKYYFVRTPHPSLPNRATHIRHDTVLKQLDVAVGRGWDVDITRSDLEYMAARPYPTFAHWVTMFVGAILMADEDDLGSIVSGRHIGGHYIRSGQRFDPSADHDQRHQAVFRAVGLDLVSTVAGLTEVATMLVATHHPMFDLSSSCLLSTTPGAVCGRCDKCFRKELIRAWVEARPPDSRILQWGENDPTTRRRFERYETTQQPHAFAFLACRIEGLEDSFLSRWVQQFDDPFSATEWVPKSYPRAIAEWVPARWREQVTANVARYLATMGPDDIRVVETWPEPLRHQTE